VETKAKLLDIEGATLGRPSTIPLGR